MILRVGYSSEAACAKPGCELQFMCKIKHLGVHLFLSGNKLRLSLHDPMTILFNGILFRAKGFINDTVLLWSYALCCCWTERQNQPLLNSEWKTHVGTYCRFIFAGWTYGHLVFLVIFRLPSRILDFDRTWWAQAFACFSFFLYIF